MLLDANFAKDVEKRNKEASGHEFFFFFVIPLESQFWKGKHLKETGVDMESEV